MSAVIGLCPASVVGATATDAGHMVTICLDEALVRAARQDGDTVDPLDRGLWRVQIRCLGDRDDVTRGCVAWRECLCELTDQQWDALAFDGEGPCPESRTGTHRHVVGDISPARPSRDCWAMVCPESVDAVIDLAERHDLCPGEYRVGVRTVADGQHVEFDLVVAE